MATGSNEPSFTTAMTAAVLDEVPALVAYVDRQLRYVFANRAYHEYHGRPAGTMVGQLLPEVMGAQTLALVRSAITDALAGVPADTEQAVIDGAGRLRHLRARFLPDRLDDIVVGFYVIAADVTERVDAENERDEAQRLFRIAVEHAPIGKAVVGPDGRWLQVNRAFCNLTGYTAEELMPTTVMQVIHPDDLATGSGGADFDFEPGATDHGSDIRIVRKDGTIIWTHRTAVVIPGPNPADSVIIVQVQDITARKKAEDDLARLALSDPLTGLHNRFVLMDRLEHALAGARRRGTQVGVMFIDLDRFKQINDRYGHARGDELLRQVAARLRRHTRDDDTSVRMGGDEFVTVIENVDNPVLVALVAARIQQALNEPYEIDGLTIQVFASIGYTCGAGPTPEDLLRQADSAMYRSKAGGRGQVHVYDRTAQATAKHIFKLEDELRQALADEQFELWYQPIIRLPAGTIVSREALIRWRHPERGLLAPDTFLPTAERTGLIVSIGRWVLRRACLDAADFPATCSVSVNVSAHELASAEFPDYVRQCLRTADLPADRLVLEITESLVLTASQSTLRATAALTRLGVRISLDDFGTGQSSITALHRLPVSALKIDRSFVAEIPSGRAACALVDGLIHLGLGMGLDVIAEGVENQEQSRWLDDHHCPHAQGYLYGRPTAVEPGPGSPVLDQSGRDQGQPHGAAQ